MAAGEGRRLRPLTERWPKPVLPIDGRPVIAILLRELAASGIERATVVTGHLADQVEALAEDGAYGLEVRFARQPEPLGSADAVQRAVKAGTVAPFLVSAADTVYSRGDVRRFREAFVASGARGALALRPGGDPAPLWALAPQVIPYLDGLPGPPFELLAAVERAAEAGLEIARIQIGSTRHLTHPADLVRHNFPYLETQT